MSAKILCAIDFSNVCEQIVACAAKQAACSGEEVLLLYAAPSLVQQYAEAELPHDYFKKIESGMVQKAEKGMQELIEKHFPNGGASFKIKAGYAVGTILETAKEENASMIIVGAYGHGGWEAAILGSVADKVVKKAEIPVLVVHPCNKAA